MYMYPPPPKKKKRRKKKEKDTGTSIYKHYYFGKKYIHVLFCVILSCFVKDLLFALS